MKRGWIGPDGEIDPLDALFFASAFRGRPERSESADRASEDNKEPAEQPAVESPDTPRVSEA